MGTATRSGQPRPDPGGLLRGQAQDDLGPAVLRVAGRDRPGVGLGHLALLRGSQAASRAWPKSPVRAAHAARRQEAAAALAKELGIDTAKVAAPLDRRPPGCRRPLRPPRLRRPDAGCPGAPLSGAPGAPTAAPRRAIVAVGMGTIPIDVSELVGRTPLVRFSRMAPEGVELYGKLEAFNPGGSVKDRIGVAMIEAAEREGRIEPGRSTIVEATSGNTGIALAFVCAAKGYDLVLTLPQGMSREREGLLRLYGATVEVVESLGGMDEAVNAARAMAQRDDVFLPDQFSNPANPEVHRRTTGPELWEQLDGKVDYLVCGVGTGGTVTGAGEFLKHRNPKLKVIACEPQASAVLSGRAPGPHRIQGIGAGFVPPVLNVELLDEIIPVPDEAAIETARLAARTEGVLAGLSCGAALWGALQVAERPEAHGARIAVVLPDSGERYVSLPFFAS